MQIKTRAKKWGSSLGIILPKILVESKKIKENDEIIVEVKKQPVLDSLFGKFPRKSKKSAQEIKDELRSGWESRSDREMKWR